MHHLQESLDVWRYRHRRQDAALHSRNVAWESPVTIIKAPLASSSSYSVFSEWREAGQLGSRVSHASLKHRLQEWSPEDYGVPGQKKQKKSHELPAFEKENHAHEMAKKNQDILGKMRKVFDGCGGHRCGKEAGFKKMAGRTVANENVQVQTESETKQEEEAVPPEARINGSIGNEDISITAMSRDEEIAELEKKLRAQHLSRTSEADQLFYIRLAEREANTILEEVIVDIRNDLAQNVFNEEEEKSRNKELPPELLEVVEDALHEGPMDEVLIQKYNVDITRRNLQCLLPGVWLNDEVINFYFQMMNDRDEALVKAGVLSKRSHFFNSFFYTKVSENGYNFINVRRWTRKIDLFSMDKIFMPVNVGNMHWCMAVIFMAEKRIQYFDSMHGSGAACIKVLFRYLHDESEHKKKQKFDEEGWELVTCTPDTPMQNNGSDCGVFSCLFADYLAQNRPLTFTQRDIPFHRHRMVLHVSRGYIPLEEEGL